MHILLKVNTHISEKELINIAYKMGVKTYPTSIYCDEDKNNEFPIILLGFGGVTETQIEGGIRILKNAWFDNKQK